MGRNRVINISSVNGTDVWSIHKASLKLFFFNQKKIKFFDDILTLSFLGWRKKRRIWHSIGWR